MSTINRRSFFGRAFASAAGFFGLQQPSTDAKVEIPDPYKAEADKLGILYSMIRQMSQELCDHADFDVRYKDEESKEFHPYPYWCKRCGTDMTTHLSCKSKEC